MSRVSRSFMVGDDSPPEEPRCLVAVLYDSKEDRDRALHLTDSLVQKSFLAMNFAFSWWGLRFLENPDIAESAAAATRESDVLVVSANAAQEPPVCARKWFSEWDLHQSGSPGVLLPLLHPADPELLCSSPWMALLEETARQTGMEYLLPDELRDSPFFSSPGRTLRQRAQHLSGVLDHILSNAPRTPMPPMRWGLRD